MEGQSINLGDLLAILKRRWLLLLAPAAFFAMLAAIVAVILPSVYSSTARILVESQTIAPDLARSTVFAVAEERVQLIRQRLMTRQNLLEIAERFDIFRARPDLSRTEIVKRMEEMATISSTALAQRGSSRETTVSLINISFKADRASTAAQVTSEFLSQVLTENAALRNTRAGETLRFFDTRVEKFGAELESLEEQLAAFKLENAETLPESLGFRRQELIALEERIFERETLRASLEEERRALQRDIDNGLFSSATAGIEVSSEQRKLEEMERSLAEARALYASTHPTVRNLEARIAALREMVTPTVEGQAPDTTPLEARRRFDLIEARLRLIADQLEVDAVRRKGLADSIARTPEVEKQLSALERQRANARTQYEQAVLKQATAETGEQLEVNRQAERFEVVEQPQTPERPDSPNRPVIVIAGFSFGLALGMGVIMLLELMDQSIRTPRDLERKLEMRPVVTIPYIHTRKEAARIIWIRRSLIFGLLVLAPMALWMIDRVYLPLPIIAERLADKTGINMLIQLFENRFGR